VELDLAKKAFQKVLEFNPEYQYARINMGLVEKIESQKK
jgi:lipoprotein NlpI